MLLVLPISSTVPGIERLGADLKKKGSLTDHSLRIISTRDDEGLAYMLSDELADQFRKVTTATLPAVPKPRPPVLCANQMFVEAINFLDSYEYGENEAKDAPMLYFTTDYRPTQPRWLDELQAEFFLKGAPPVMGRSISTGAKKGPDYRRESVGPVIFGRSFSKQAPLLGHLDGKQHWRIRMMHEIAQGMVETKQIGTGAKSLLRQMPSVKV